MSVQSRRFAFTSFEEEWPEWDEDWMTYMIVGRETCPDTGRLHWQGYLETKNRLTFAGLKAKPGWSSFHLEKACASSDSNREYCTKACGDDWQEWGEPMKAGKRSDLASLAASIATGTTTIADVLEENPHSYHIYGRTLERVADERLLATTRGDWAPPNVRWYWGPTGLGKSRLAREEASSGGEPVYVWELDDNGWQDRYMGQKRVVIDDFRGGLSFSALLRLLDGYEVSVRRRNRAPAPFLATDIWITSSVHPRDIFSRDLVGDERFEQLERRVTQFVQFRAL